jgi:hypothetical protein
VGLRFIAPRSHVQEHATGWKSGWGGSDGRDARKRRNGKENGIGKKEERWTVESEERKNE